MKNITVWHTLSKREQLSVGLLSTYLILLAFGQLTRQSTFDLIWYGSDILVLVWLALHLQALKDFIFKAYAWVVAHPLAWILLLWMAVSLVIGAVLSEQTRPLFLVFRLIIYTLFAGSVAQVFGGRRAVLRGMLLATGCAIAWLGFLQYVILPDTRFLMTLGWDEHYYRMVGTLLDPNFTGMLLVLTSLIALTVASRLRSSILLGILAFLAMCIALTYSRSTYVAYIFAMLLTISVPGAIPFKRFGEKVLISLLLGGVCILSLILAPKPGGEGVKLLRTTSAQARVTSSATYINSLTVWSTLFGNGLFVKPDSFEASSVETPPDMQLQDDVTVFFETPDPTAPPNHANAPDNLLVTLLSGLGIFGTIAVLALLLIGIHDLARHEVMTAIAFGSVLVHAQFNNTLFEPFIYQFLLLFILAPLPLLLKEHHNFRSTNTETRPTKIKQKRSAQKKN